MAAGPILSPGTAKGLAPQQWRREVPGRTEPWTEAELWDAQVERLSLPGSHKHQFLPEHETTDGKMLPAVCIRCGLEPDRPTPLPRGVLEAEAKRAIAAGEEELLVDESAPPASRPAQTPTEYLSCAETAKMVRAALKTAFPGVKFSVRSDTYSMGASIRVSWDDGPLEDEVKDVAGLYSGSDFDGMNDLKFPVSHFITADGTVGRYKSGGSGASIPGYENELPAGARVVHLGADFVFVSRKISGWTEKLQAAETFIRGYFRDVMPAYRIQDEASALVRGMRVGESCRDAYNRIFKVASRGSFEDAAAEFPEAQ